MMPFENIRVADFTTMLAGAGICTTLSDMGADVIKIEPLDGDPWRMVAGSFMGTNRGKRAIAIDLTKEEGRRIAYKIISKSDIMVENAKIGTMDKLKLDYKSVKKINPEIIYVSASGFGAQGPKALHPAYDPIMQALSGQMARQGGSAPVYHKIALNDEATPLVGAFGAALALFHKMNTGHGQLVQTSLLNSAVALQSGEFIEYKGIKRKNIGGPDIKGTNALNRLYQGNDGEWFFLMAEKEDHWQALCKMLGISALAGAKFKTPSSRKRHAVELSKLLQDTFYSTPASGWVFMLQLSGIPSVMSLHLDDVLKDKHCLDTGVFVDQQHPSMGNVRTLNALAQFSETPVSVRRPSPRLGENTDEILGELAYKADEIEEFKRGKLVVQAGEK